ncbi:hypothetical protein WN944_014963 [Citrus x changshan-huyou]|uniref:Uncharacterized protein n=1 Tax=Citrus x changshan-huyou TaxID=2935761 RepID=A0AAP0MD30_9ROSI
MDLEDKSPFRGEGIDEAGEPCKITKVHTKLRKWLKDNVNAEVTASTRIILEDRFCKWSNCKDLAAQLDNDGFLGGGASLKVLCYPILDKYRIFLIPTE